MRQAAADSSSRKRSFGNRQHLANVIEVHAYVEVSDIERGIAFYTRGIGLVVVRRLKPGWVELAGASIPLYLLARPESDLTLGGRTLERSYSRHWTPVHLDFLVADLDTAIARAESSGATIEKILRNRPWGAMANAADPFGNGFDLIELSPLGYDALSPEQQEPDEGV
jgi:predicted enzyme related to lactoylglutathione lyase